MFNDKIVISCNYKDGTKTVNFSEMESALSMRASASGSDLDCPGAPRQKKLTPFRFPGFRTSQESSISVSSFFLSETGVSQGTPVSVINASSNLDCPGAPRQKKLTPFRFPGLSKSQESSISVSSFFLSETEVSRGTPVSVINASSDLDCPSTPKKNCGALASLFLLRGHPWYLI